MTAPPPVAYVLDLPYLARRAWHAVAKAAMNVVKAHREQMPDAWEALVEKDQKKLKEWLE